MTYRLPLTIRPHPDESGISWVERLAERNFVQLRRLRRLLAGERSIDKWKDRDWELAAIAASLDPADLAHLRRNPMAGPARTAWILGEQIRPSYLIQGSQRVCPACIVERNALLAIWDIAQAPVCVRHGLNLVDTCPCGLRLTDRNRGARPRSCGCGRLFNDMPRIAASRPAQLVVRWIEQLALPKAARATEDIETIACPFRELALGDLLLTIELLGRAVLEHEKGATRDGIRSCFRAGGLPNHVPVADSVACIEAAAHILLDWPDAYRSLLDRVASDYVPTPTRFATRGLPSKMFASSAGASLMRPWKVMDGKPLPHLLSAMDEWCRANISAPRKCEVPSIMARWNTRERMRSIADEVGTSATKRFTVSYRRLLRSLDSGIIDDAVKKSLIDGLRPSCAPEKKELDVRETLNLIDCGHQYHFRPWIHPDLLAPSKGKIDGPRSKLRFNAMAVRSLAERMARVSNIVSSGEIPSGFVPVNAQGNAFFAEWYTKTDLIRDVLAERVAAVATVAAPRFNDLFVDQRAADRSALIARVSFLLAQDRCYKRFELFRLSAALWPHAAPIPLDLETRMTGRVEHVQIDNRTGGRIRPAYRFRLSSFLRAQWDTHGPCIDPAIDDLIR